MTFVTQIVQLRKLVDDATRRMLDADTWLIESDAGEPCLCARLALHMKRALEDPAYRDYAVDVAYSEGVAGCDYAQNRLGDGVLVADLAVHKRGKDGDDAVDNLLAVELRKQADDADYGDALAKLGRLTDPRYGYMYKLGVLVVVDGGDMYVRDAFAQGREVEPDMSDAGKGDRVMVVNKLVRDKAPEMMAARGKTCICEKLSDKDFARRLDEKLSEKLGEYQRSKRIVELADLLEVIYAVAKLRGWSPEDLELARAAKAEKHGGFEKKLFLKEVRERPSTRLDDADDLLGALAVGVDPFTGEMMPEDHVCRQTEDVLALRQTLRVRQKRPGRRMRVNAGALWSEEEEARLIEEYDAGMKEREIAKLHGRTKNEVIARLRRLGKLER